RAGLGARLGALSGLGPHRGRDGAAVPRGCPRVPGGPPPRRAGARPRHSRLLRPARPPLLSHRGRGRVPGVDDPPGDEGAPGGGRRRRIAAPAVAEPEAARLTGEGLAAVLVPEAEARIASRPRLALGGDMAGGTLTLRTSEGMVGVERRDLLLVVQGPIAREYQ